LALAKGSLWVALTRNEGTGEETYIYSSSPKLPITLIQLSVRYSNSNTSPNHLALRSMDTPPIMGYIGYVSQPYCIPSYQQFYPLTVGYF